MHRELVRIYKKHNINEEIDSEAEGLLVTADISTYYLIVDSEFLTHNTIAHEVFHVVTKMTEARDIFEEEAQAWIAGHVSNDIYKFLDKKKFKVKYE
jgi:heterodisulfide reductase subunit B